ncbi:GM22618 [Drosophila sechellia]|uniref:GM22618 n=1 Tax=Drosophila sechellia TaxID=7238 RepID=B4I6I5_DROSE|nr:GM22618 [Drosophila sechellia]
MMNFLVVKESGERIADISCSQEHTTTQYSPKLSQVAKHRKLAQLEIASGSGLLGSGTGTGTGSGCGPAIRWQLLLLLLLCNCIDLTVSNKISSVGAFEPDFVIPLENVTIAQGRDATFTCVVNNLGGHRVSGDGSSAPAKVCIGFKRSVEFSTSVPFRFD